MCPSSIRTGTSTWTSRNGEPRMRRMYGSRSIRLAARSNWLSAMDFPDIVARGAQSFGERAPDRKRGTRDYHLPEAPPRVVGDLEEGLHQGIVTGRDRTRVGRQHDGPRFGEPALGGAQVVGPARRVEGEAPRRDDL